MFLQKFLFIYQVSSLGKRGQILKQVYVLTFCRKSLRVLENKEIL